MKKLFIFVLLYLFSFSLFSKPIHRNKIKKEVKKIESIRSNYQSIGRTYALLLEGEPINQTIEILMVENKDHKLEVRKASIIYFFPKTNAKVEEVLYFKNSRLIFV